jgi:hypothetical protein
MDLLEDKDLRRGHRSDLRPYMDLLEDTDLRPYMDLLEDTDLRRGNRSEAIHGFESYIYSGT